MDRVRFGRALGAGAREAARALMKAADAAAAPNPNAAAHTSSAVRPVPASIPGPVPRPVPPEVQSPARQGGAGARAAQQVVRARRSAATTTAGVREGSSRFGRAVWRPFVKLSGVLWLEMTGVFFGLFAVTAAVGVWKSRGELHGEGTAEHRIWFAAGMLVLFGYFSISSFLRARRRGRG